MAWLNSFDNTQYSPWDKPSGMYWVEVPPRPSANYVWENGNWCMPGTPSPFDNELHLKNGAGLKQRQFEELAETNPLGALLLKEGINVNN